MVKYSVEFAPDRGICKVIKMWNMIVSYLPDWKVCTQAFIVFFVPYVISKFFNWVHAAEEE
jgi:spore germination protein